MKAIDATPRWNDGDRFFALVLWRNFHQRRTSAFLQPKDLQSFSGRHPMQFGIDAIVARQHRGDAGGHFVRIDNVRPLLQVPHPTGSHSKSTTPLPRGGAFVQIKINRS